VAATGALRTEARWIHEPGAAGASHVKTVGAVDNQPTRENLRRLAEWETAVMTDLFGG
jgi:hypothetical protein